MKKIIVTLSIILSCICTAKAQDITFVNNTNIDMWVEVSCGSLSTTCQDAISHRYQIACNSTVSFSMYSGGSYTPLTWNTTPASGLDFTLVRYFDALPPCSLGHVDLNIVGDGTCASGSNFLTVTCPCAGGLCGSSPATVSATWTPGTNVTVTFN